MSEKTCIICGKPLAPRQQKYCSPPCAIKANTIARANDPERMKRTMAAKARWQRANPDKCKTYRDALKTERVCDWCGEMFESRTPDATCCCPSHGAMAKRGEGPSCKWTPFRSAYHNGGCDLRSDLRRGTEDGTADDVVAALRERSIEDEHGCWIWQGQRVKGGKGTGAYPVIRMGGKSRRLLHRLIADKCHGPIGKQPVHHTCANTLCVNPEHLQPISQRENIAEMLHRKWYTTRIEELERALAELDPAHPALTVRAS